MIAFVHIHKTAGTTFTSILRRNFGIRHFDRPGSNDLLLGAADLRRLQRVFWNLQSLGGHTIRPYSDLKKQQPSLRYYTFLRDPVKRSISHFTWYLRWKANDGVVFDSFEQAQSDWLGSEAQQNFQCQNLCGSSDPAEAIRCLDEDIDFVGIVEQFDSSLLLWKDWVGFPDFDLRYESLNTSHDRYERLQDKNPDYLERVTEYLRALKNDVELQRPFSEVNEGDVALYRHAESVHWERQIQGYSGNLEDDVAALQNESRDVGSLARDHWAGRLHRNLIVKPLRNILIQR